MGSPSPSNIPAEVIYLQSHTDVHAQIHFPEACRVLSKQEPQNLCVNKECQFYNEKGALWYKYCRAH